MLNKVTLIGSCGKDPESRFFPSGGKQVTISLATSERWKDKQSGERGVGFEDRQDLLGHHAGRITTHYSKVEISRLIDCVEQLCETRKPELTLIRRVI